MTGLYLHIPFCHARCGYCDFTTFTGKEDQIRRYVDALQNELTFYDRCPIATVFLGGGTPSLLNGESIASLVTVVRDRFELDPHAEITLEANPESITLEKAMAWRAAGVNRISLGLQAMDDTLLKAMDRLHTVEEFKTAYRQVREAGFTNVSVDLIYGFPEQSLASWQDTLRQTVAWSPDHLSLYALKVEDHTPFRAKNVQVSDDLQAAMYEWARTFLSTEGYPQYEISNFARQGRECQHNLLYWRQKNYIGAGVGAVGCVDGMRWENHKNLVDYFRDVKLGVFPRVSTEMLDPSTRRFERLMLGLRLREGIAWDEADATWLAERARLASLQWLEEMEPGRWRIPDHAVLFTNQALLPFV